MNERNKYIFFWFGKVIFFGFFLFILAAFSSNTLEFGENNSNIVTTEFVAKTNNSAIVGVTPSAPEYKLSLSVSSCLILKPISENNLSEIELNSSASLLVDLCSQRFVEIKPRLLEHISYHRSSSNTDEEFALIS